MHCIVLVYCAAATAESIADGCALIAMLRASDADLLHVISWHLRKDCGSANL
jgi:hypothetical protein